MHQTGESWITTEHGFYDSEYGDMEVIMPGKRL